MARPPKFQGESLKAVKDLLRKHGLSQTRDILAADESSELASLRDQQVFPKPVSVCLPTLCRISGNAGMSFKRGRVNPIRTAHQKRYVISLVKQFGALKTCEILAGEDRNVRLFPEPVSVTPPTVAKVAREGGITLTRGRRRVKKAA